MKSESDVHTLHGVFMRIYKTGVLLMGKSGIGKSEFALDLVDRGHQLIADDAPEFSKTADNSVIGKCPKAGFGFLAITGVGIVDLCKLYGEDAYMKQYPLQLIIHLVDNSQFSERGTAQTQGTISKMPFFGQSFTTITLATSSYHNMALLIETAVRNHVLKQQGNDAYFEFTQQLQQQVKV